MTDTTQPASHNYFVDHRQTYLTFVNTTTEKQEVALRMAEELSRINPRPDAGALRLFDAGIGDGTVLTQVLSEAHAQYPNVPFYVTGKEISIEDVRIALGKMSDRFSEHPDTVFVITNMSYAIAPWLKPKADIAGDLVWNPVKLESKTAAGFRRELSNLEGFLNQSWRTVSTPKGMVAENPVVLVISRADRKFPLNSVIPTPETAHADYDLVMAVQPWRSRASATQKAKNILAPLSKALAHGGNLVCIQARNEKPEGGLTPAMEIIKRVWPQENPYPVGLDVLMGTTRNELGDMGRHFSFHAGKPFEYRMHPLQIAPNGTAPAIGTSALNAAWGNAVYVAQMDDSSVQAIPRDMSEAITRDVLLRGDLTFANDVLVIHRY